MGADPRDEQVELLLYCERPEVLERRRRQLCREVIGANGGEVEVGEEYCRPAGIGCGLVTEDDADPGIGHHHRDNDDKRGGGNDAPAPAPIEGDQGGPTGRPALSQ